MSRKIPEIITKEEYTKLCEYIQKLKPCNYKEYLLAICLGFEAGLRISEIVGYKDKVPILEAAQFNFERNNIMIKSGKGNKDRIVPLPKSIKPSHLSILPLKLKRRSLQHFIEKHSQVAIGKKIHFHTLRHGFGTHLINSGIQLTTAQNLMGHSNISTTSIYVHTNPQKAVEQARDVF